jgi:YtcA family
MASAAAGHSPSIDVLGSYFPAWLLCIVAGVILTIIARLLFIAWKLDAYLLPAPIVYPCLAAVFAMAVWLIFFGANL